MARGLPSLAALLGLVAVAGYQNRDKIGEFIKGLDDPQPGRGDASVREERHGDSPLAINIKAGMGELVEQFRQNGQGATAESWVATGPNNGINEVQLAKALGSDLINRLIEQTGLSRETLLSRLSQILPEAVD